MCRLAAYLGPAIALEDIIIAPPHSLIMQSKAALEAKLTVNGDGFGIAWYGTRLDPGLYKNILPAWSDGNLLNLCQHIVSPLFLAHVRASTGGGTSQANCHPFTYENWAFMHNGQTGGFTAMRRPLEACLPDPLYALRRGSTDSELLFLLLLSHGLATDPQAACQSVLQLLTETARQLGVVALLRQTCVFSDGRHLYCYRYASDGRCPSLYVSRQFVPGGLVVASEPLDGPSAHWAEVAPNQLVRLDLSADAALGPCAA